MIPKPCIEAGCPRLAVGGPRHPRCRACQREWDTQRNARPGRARYIEPGYLANARALYGQPCALRIEGVCTGVATTADHIVPISEGGTNTPSNLQPACRPCNSSRATKKRD